MNPPKAIDIQNVETTIPKWPASKCNSLRILGARDPNRNTGIIDAVAAVVMDTRIRAQVGCLSGSFPTTCVTPFCSLFDPDVSVSGSVTQIGHHIGFSEAIWSGILNRSFEFSVFCDLHLLVIATDPFPAASVQTPHRAAASFTPN